MRLYIGQQMALPALNRLCLRKSRSEAAATLTAELFTAPADTLSLNLSLALGDPVHLVDEEGNAAFTGSIHELERTPESVIMTAYDRGIYLARNQLHGAYVGTPGDIVRQVAEELGLPTGTVEAGDGWRVIVTGAGESAFSILRQAVGEEGEIAVCGQALTVTRGSCPVYPLQPSCILEIRGTASIRNMVNRAVIIGRNGRVYGSAENAGDIQRFGRFQTVRLREGLDRQAETFLTGRAFTGSLTVFGNLAYRCGAAVELHRPDWGLDGIYTVTGSEHRWESGLFTTALELKRAV